MAYDKVIDSTALDNDLSAVADAIRAKGGTSAALAFPDGFVSAVAAITTGGGDTEITLQAKSVTPSESKQTVVADTGYDGLSSVAVGAISSTYVGSGVTKKTAQAYTPTTSNQTIASGQYLSGVQTIKGDSNLLASNIKSGVSIFGVSGTYEGSGGGGGLPSGISALTVGTATPSENETSTFSVSHNLGVTPNFCLWWADGDYSATAATNIAVLGAMIAKPVMYSASSTTVYGLHFMVRGYSGSSAWSGSASQLTSADSYFTTTTAALKCNSTYPFVAGVTYRYIVGVFE